MTGSVRGFRFVAAGVLLLSGWGYGVGFQAASTQPSAPIASLAREEDKPPMTAKQKQLQEDLDRLVTMAAELKTSVDKSKETELSLDVVRKAEAVEKLARSLKERIREAK